MYHSFPSMDQLSWSNAQDVPCIFPLSPAPSDCSHGPPQIQLDLDDPTSTSFQNIFKELEDFYAPPCADISAIPGREDLWDAFNLSQLFSVNAGLPPRSAGQTLPGQQPVFGDAQFPFPFDADNFCLAPTTHKSHIPAPVASLSVPGPPPPRFPPLPPPPTDQTSFLPNSQLDGPIFLACPTPSKSVSTPGDSARQEDSRVTTPPPKRGPSQRESGRPSKRRKTGKADNDDGIPLLQCCMTVKPESLARHLKSDGHKRNAGLPLSRPEVCSFCNIAFARQDARNRHFRSQHGGDTPPAAAGTVQTKLKRPSATHPSLLPKKRKQTT